jgi:8-oxo-dGTP diphosphatase
MKRLLRQYLWEVLDGFGTGGLRYFDSPHNLRYDVELSPERGQNIFSDEERDNDWDSKNRAAICFIRRKDGKILAVSRGVGVNSWGLPGGHCERCEPFSKAAARECFEETGLMVLSCNQIYIDKNDAFTVACFACKVEGEITPSDEGDVKWVDKSTLLNPETSPFSTYFKNMMSDLNL